MSERYNIARANLRDVDVLRKRERERVREGLAPSDVRHRAGSLLDRYQVPPFSVLDTRQGYWQEARRSWLALGIRSELGRGFNEDGVAPGTSIFDPVLCELAYRWWCPPGGAILDPFAGGSVRGIVAAWLDHAYTGVDLSAAQVASNREQANAIMGTRPHPTWIVGDSRRVIPQLGQEWVDFIFTCPPYYDLEVYSDDPADLSAMTDWPAFLGAYGDIIGHSLTALRRDRFAAIVVSEIRGRDGIFRGLVPWTIRQFEMHGARYYNEAVLINPAATLPMRVGRQFDAGRKLGRSHQNVLVFVKGDVPRTHEWGYEGTRAPDPQLEMFDMPALGADGRPA